ncbi:MlaD family protein [Mycobacterium branderi]|uniref:ABC transporter substrate-binding protein n=1 Tax=Mycobacterium branderi TaxID=43348 RepID=A0A7I7WCZ1_9MYCO|nr:MlaD family protein [Mycobacterium branderi]MCV7234617.1 MCE family protein [Mycobacterium branderi]ORA33158.1 mammalian cell entry protein [Mycobacterium branderi]BBZ15406.1 ABC transporter substrate-binding protein [Mycobacterium branderi]
MKPKAALWRLAISALIGIVLFILVANAITQPTATDVRTYTAEFTDVSGLHLDADVRVRGVRVGKVQSVELKRRRGQSIAAVRFTLDKRYGVVSGTRLAVKYQALTGLRYVDVENPTESYSTADLVTHVTTAMTQPSFDITALFNGLQPVLATLNPDELNTFTANAASYLSGDGSGLASMLESIRKLTRFVSDRERVIATLMHNLSEISDVMGGHSKDLIQLVDWVNRPVNGALDALDEFRKSQVYGGEFSDAVLRILTNMGFPRHANSGAQFVYGTPDQNATNIDEGLDRAFTVLDDFTDAFKLVPVMWENIPPPPAPGAPLPCSKGRAQLPEQMDVLLNGRRVILCNR